MNKMTDLFPAAAVVLSVFAAVSAHAEPPEECAGNAVDERFYNLGYVKGVSLVDQAWDGLGPNPCECDPYYFADIVAAAFAAGTPAPGSPHAVWCHWAGSYQGAIERANELLYVPDDTATSSDDKLAFSTYGFRCPLFDCYFDGYLIGEMAATFYCELSIAFGGLGLDEWLVRGSFSFCGLFFTYGCDRSFDYHTSVYPEDGGDQQCLPYTVEPFLEVYAQTRYNQCLYDIAESQ